MKKTPKLNKQALMRTIVNPIVVCGLLGGVSVAASLAVYQRARQQGSTETVYTTQSLLEFDGKNGRRCMVAVYGNVYEIEQTLLWKDGDHTTAAGVAYCGADMSSVIQQSPHGTSKLEALTKRGTFRQ